MNALDMSKRQVLKTVTDGGIVLAHATAARMVAVHRLTPASRDPGRCDSVSWAGRRPRLARYVTRVGPMDGATAARGRLCCLSSIKTWVPMFFITTRDEIATVISSVNRPVNVVMGLQGVQLTLAELSGLGVKRVSVGSALYRTAIGAFMRAPQEMQESGSLSFAGHAATPHELSRIMR